MKQDIDHIENSVLSGPGCYDKHCSHDRTKVLDWCKGRNCECQARDCGVLDDGIPDCNELCEHEICEGCGVTL